MSRSIRRVLVPGIVPALAILLLAAGAAGAEGDCDAVAVHETMLPVSGYLVSLSCIEAYGPWDEAGLASCQGELAWTTLERGALDFGDEYVLLACDGTSLFLVREEHARDEEVSWGSLKALFR